jgi:hypothetical protein
MQQREKEEETNKRTIDEDACVLEEGGVVL